VIAEVTDACDPTEGIAVSKTGDALNARAGTRDAVTGLGAGISLIEFEGVFSSSQTNMVDIL
jgi:hypothetical protein